MGATQAYDKAYLSFSEEGSQPGKPMRAANIIRLPMCVLEIESGFATGLPIHCKGCQGILGMYSKSRIQFDKIPQIWTCEYCDYENALNIDVPEIPDKQIMTYFLDSNGKNISPHDFQASINKEDESTIIFCVDVSGSMKMSQKIKEQKKLKYVKKKDEPTRLECVKVAIDAQIQQMLKENPNRKIGIVTFGNDIAIYGDCQRPKKVLSGNILDNFEEILETVNAIANTFMSQPIKNSSLQIFQALDAISAGGSTALGPGLLTSLALACTGPKGSKVIICTDGLANVGLGSVENLDEESAILTNKFYSKIGSIAQSKGIMISIISLVLSECRLDLLSPVSQMTNGNIARLDPINLSDDFSDFLAETIIATNVSVEVRLHKCLQFIKEEDNNLFESKSVMRKNLGNVSRDSVLTFEYSVKPINELQKIPNFAPENLKFIPLQAVLTYESQLGIKCQRIICQVSETTTNYSEAQKSVHQEVASLRAAQRLADNAKKANFKGGLAETDDYVKDFGVDLNQANPNLKNIYNEVEEHSHSTTSRLKDNLVSLTNMASKESAKPLNKMKK